MKGSSNMFVVCLSWTSHIVLEHEKLTLNPQYMLLMTHLAFSIRSEGSHEMDSESLVNLNQSL